MLTRCSAVVNDSGVYLPPSPPDKRSFWRRTPTSTTSSSHRSALSENEPFSISRESFDSYRRSFVRSAQLSPPRTFPIQSHHNRPRTLPPLLPPIRFPSPPLTPTRTSPPVPQSRTPTPPPQPANPSTPLSALPAPRAPPSQPRISSRPPPPPKTTSRT